MNPMDANCLVTDCGSMVGHQQRELELVRECVAFFGIDPNDVTTERHFDMRVSSGQTFSYRIIFRPDNAMWRIEFNTGVPEIDDGIFPIVNGVRRRRSNHGAVFHKLPDGGGAFCSVVFVPLDSDEYQGELDHCNDNGELHRTRNTPQGRDYGWY